MISPVNMELECLTWKCSVHNSHYCPLIFIETLGEIILNCITNKLMLACRFDFAMSLKASKILPVTHRLHKCETVIQE